MNKIRSYLDDGLSNREILKKVNKYIIGIDGVPITTSQLAEAINKIMDDADSDSDTSSVDTYDSEYEDEEWTEESEESEDESEAEESEAEESDEESEAEESEAEESETDVDDLEPKIRHHMTIYMNHDHGEYHDKITVEPQGMGEFHVRYAYDKVEGRAAHLVSEFAGTSGEVSDYLYHVLRMLSIDEKPYASIDIDVPYYPNISIRPGSLKKRSTRHIIMDAIDDYLADNDVFEEDA
jgi:hypothetical protein